MNRQFFLTGLICAFSFFWVSLAGAEEPQSTYAVEMTGVVCSSCKDHVREAFAKLNGVTSIEFEGNGISEKQKVVIKSTSAALTKEDAVKALGSAGQDYLVLAWTLKK